MKTINDNDFRHALIERFLDCDTTVEEERELARFYSECKQNGCVPEDESRICELVLATIAIPQQQHRAVPQRQRRVSWLRVACAAAVIAVLLVMTITFNIDFIKSDDQRSTVASTLASTKHDTDFVAKSSVMVDAPDVASAAATMPMVNATQQLQGKASASASSGKRNCAALPHTGKVSSPSMDNIDMAEIYSTVSSLFHDVSNVLIERGSKGILVSSVDENGEKHSFLVNGTGDGGLAITAI